MIVRFKYDPGQLRDESGRWKKSDSKERRRGKYNKRNVVGTSDDKDELDEMKLEEEARSRSAISFLKKKRRLKLKRIAEREKRKLELERKRRD